MYAGYSARTSGGHSARSRSRSRSGSPRSRSRSQSPRPRNRVRASSSSSPSPSPRHQDRVLDNVADSEKRFWAAHVVDINRLKSNIKWKQTVCSTVVCRIDPQTTFRLHIHFGGERDGWMSVWIKPTDQTVSIITMEVTLRDEEGKLLKKKIQPREYALGKRERLGWKDFFEFGPNADGTWRLRCEIEYGRRGDNSSEKARPSRLQEDLLTLLEGSSDTDVTFKLKDGEIAAHKCILGARSSYFSNMFHSGMKEGTSNKVEILDFESNVFRGVLHYLYSGSTPKNLADIDLELLIAADKYGLDELKRLCEDSICRHLGADNVVDVLLTAERTNSVNLISSSRAVFRAERDSLRRSKEALDKLKGNPDLLLELLLHYCDECALLRETLI